VLGASGNLWARAAQRKGSAEKLLANSVLGWPDGSGRRSPAGTAGSVSERDRAAILGTSYASIPKGEPLSPLLLIILIILIIAAVGGGVFVSNLLWLLLVIALIVLIFNFVGGRRAV
jgi:hypothetical protein